MRKEIVVVPARRTLRRSCGCGGDRPSSGGRPVRQRRGRGDAAGRRDAGWGRRDHDRGTDLTGETVTGAATTTEPTTTGATTTEATTTTQPATPSAPSAPSGPNTPSAAGEAPATESSQLPFTGIALGLIVAGGLARRLGTVLSSAAVSRSRTLVALQSRRRLPGPREGRRDSGCGGRRDSALTLSARAEGAYGTRAWGPLGLGPRRGPSRSSPPYGLRGEPLGWLSPGRRSLASRPVGGRLGVSGADCPQVAWTALAPLRAIAVTALVLGALASPRPAARDAVVPGGVARRDTAAQAVEILVRTGAGSAPDASFNGRLLEGPVGYHNAQALLCAVGRAPGGLGRLRRPAPRSSG